MKFFSAIKQAGVDFSDDECMTSGAALAYYTIFSLPPLLVIVFAVAGWTGVESSKIDSMVKRQLGIPITEVPTAGAGSQVASSGKTSRSQGNAGPVSNIAGLGWASQVIGIAILVFSATGLFAQFQFALNRAWEVEPDPEQGGVMSFAVKRLLSLGMVAIIAFLLLVSFVLTTLVNEAVEWLQGPSPGTFATAIAIVLNDFVTLVIATLLFAAMFKVLPDAKTSWRDLFLGSAVTALLFVIGKSLIGWYLQNSNVGSRWGSAASSMVAVLVWVYYSSLIVLFGAELTQVWASRYGRGIQPAEGAVRIIEEKRHIREETPRSRKPRERIESRTFGPFP